MEVPLEGVRLTVAVAREPGSGWKYGPERSPTGLDHQVATRL